MTEKLRLYIVDKEENSRNIIKNYLSETFDNYENEFILEEPQSLENVADRGSEIENTVLLVDISEETEKNLEIIKRIKKETKKIFIITLSNKASTEMIIKSLRSGAKEFVSKPIIKTEFQDAIKNVLNEIKNNETESACKIISTFSNKGGIGKTSIAVNLAVELAQMSKEKVALIDLNLQLGDVSTFLDMMPSFAMDYIAKNIENLTEDELLKTLSRYKNTSLYVIADPLNIDKSQEITADEIKNILTTLKKTFSYIVIDIGTNIDSKTITALDMSDLILLIAIVNLPAIRSTQRCMELFNKLGYSKDKIKLVLNRYMENEEIKTTDIEEVVKQKVYWKIPNNYLTMMTAINKGVPVNAVNAEANISINYKEFASKIADYLITQNINKNYN